MPFNQGTIPSPSFNNSFTSAENLYSQFNNLANATINQASDNLATGNLDFQRDMYKLGLEQDFLREQTARNNAFNAEQTALARAENRYLASTQYQRAKEDMIKSGLNPYLLYGGNGNSVGSAVSASSSPSSSPNSSINASGQGYAHLLGQSINALATITSSALNGIFGLSRAKIPRVTISRRLR